MYNKCLSFLLFVVILFYVIACTSTQEVPQTPIKTESKVDIQSKEENMTKIKNITLSVPKSVLIFVDDFTYQQLSSELNRLANDIKNDLDANVYIQHSNYSNPIEIRNIIKEYHQTKGLLGSILIGDIPHVMVENAGGGFIGNIATPSDSYYQDLDDVLWTDFNKNGFFDARIGLQPPAAINEVWSGRIKPTETGEKGIVQLRDYLNRNHEYRISPPKSLKQLLYYNAVYEEDVVKGVESSTVEKWLDNSMKNIAIYTSNDPNSPFFDYSDIDYVNFINLSTPEAEKEDYLSKLRSTDYEIVLTNIHGDPSYVYINKGVSITNQEIRELKPRGLFYIMASCSTAKFTEPQYYGGELLFNGRGLGVYGFTEPVGISGYPTLLGINFLMDYSPLRLGVIWGDIIKHDTNSVAVFLGDPTLRLRPKYKMLDTLKWEIGGSFVEEIRLGEKATIFRIKNLGSKPLLLSAVNTPGNYVAINDRVSIFEFQKNLYPDIAANPLYTTEELLIGLISPSEEDIQSKGVFNPIPDGNILSGFRLLENETLEFVIDLIIPKENIDSEREEELVQFYHTNDASRPYIELHAKVRIKPPIVPIQIQQKGVERG